MQDEIKWVELCHTYVLSDLAKSSPMMKLAQYVDTECLFIHSDNSTSIFLLPETPTTIKRFVKERPEYNSIGII